MNSQLAYAARETQRLEALERATRIRHDRDVVRPSRIRLTIPRPPRRLRPATAA